MDIVVTVIVLLLGLLVGAVTAFLFARSAQRAALAAAVEQAVQQGRIELATQVERAAARAAEAESLRQRLGATQAQLDAVRHELSVAREEGVRVATELAEEREQATEKLALLERARETLTAQFKTLANDILEEKSKRFSEQNRGELDLLLRPLGEKIQAFEKKVEETYVTEAKERFSLSEEVRKLQATNLQISQEALNLTRALKGESKTRGNWGEVILERVLERSGLVKGREYVTQATLETEEGRLRPDVIINLPDSKHIVVDSKVSLVAYDRFYATEDDAERRIELNNHVRAMRKHVDDLAAKRYQSRADVNAPDFVAMFVPIEPAFNLAAAHDDTLYLDAFDKKVVIVTPSTLLAMLTTVAALWQRENQTRNALEIAEQSGGLFDQFVLVIEALSDVGKKLDDAQRAFQLTENRLRSGRGNLVKRIEDLRKMGAKAKRQLPSALVESAEAEDAAAPAESVRPRLAVVEPARPETGES